MEPSSPSLGRRSWLWFRHPISGTLRQRMEAAALAAHAIHRVPMARLVQILGTLLRNARLEFGARLPSLQNALVLFGVHVQRLLLRLRGCGGGNSRRCGIADGRCCGAVVVVVVLLRCRRVSGAGRWTVRTIGANILVQQDGGGRLMRRHQAGVAIVLA